MGYIYQGKKLCCDFCGHAGASKMRCPSGWCQPTATCPECRKAGKHKLGHYNCAGYSARAKRDSDEQAAHHAQGIPTLWSASFAKHDRSLAHVLFKIGNFDTKQVTGYFIPSDIYDQRVNMRGYPIPADFAALGTITPAPADF